MQPGNYSTQTRLSWLASAVVVAIGIVVYFSPSWLELAYHVTSRALFHDIPNVLIGRIALPGLITSLCSLGASRSQDRSNWTLTTDNFIPNHYQAAPYVSNGYFGQALPAEGVGYWTQKKPDGSQAKNGWPLDQPRATFGTISGFWNLQEKVKYPILEENVRRGGESVISGIPDWTGLVVTTDQGESYKPGVDPETVLRYSQGQSLSDGIVTTNVTWKSAKTAHPFQLNYTVLAHHSRLSLGVVRLDLTVTGPVRFSLTDVLDGEGATRTQFAEKGFVDVDDENVIWTSVKPYGVEDTTAYVASRVCFAGFEEHEAMEVARSRRDATGDTNVVSRASGTIAQTWDIGIAEGETRTITALKYVGVASTDAFPSRARAVVFDTANSASQTPWDELIREHRDSWASIWDDTDIVVPGNKEVQTTVRAALFHLLSNTVSDAKDEDGLATNPSGMTDNSIPVGGLTSDSYAGLVFWDSEVWMYPALLALQPDRARPMLNYRQRLLSQAQENSQLYSRPGALYPWTSGRYGNCTGTGVCALYQYHLNTDIAMAHWNYYLYGGDKTWLCEKGWPLMKSVADMFAEYVALNETTGLYETKQLAEPDEFAYDIDNGAFNNAGIKLLLGEWAPKAAAIVSGSDQVGTAMVSANWSSIARDMKIPYDEEGQIIVEYEGMDATVHIKQASVTLISYPLGWKISEQQALNDMAFYSRATTPDGPAMTWAIYAILALQLHTTGCAGYTYLLQASQPYIREPYYQFSEQRTDAWSVADAAKGVGDKAAELEAHLGSGETAAAFPFLTGYGGYLQIFTHGFTGMRAELDTDGNGGAVLVVDPVMVPQFPEGLQIRGIKFHGAVLDFNIGLAKTTISRRRSRLGPFTRSADDDAITLRLGGKAADPADYTLRPGDHITVSTRRADLEETTVPGNMAQCAPVWASSRDQAQAASTSSWVAGRHPVAAVDGSVDTVWQPLDPAQEASIVIDLGHKKQVNGVVIHWASAPATQLIVEGERWPVSPDTVHGWDQMTKMDSIPISSPYDASKAHRIAVPESNVTNLSLGRTWDIRRVRLTILGTQGVDTSSGATVAEVSII